MTAQTAEQIGRMTQRYLDLEAVKRRVDAELTTLGVALRKAGVVTTRERKPATHTVSEAREAHNRWQRGIRTPWVVDGERQYQRERKRRARPLRQETK